jgi:hypothetical protein
MSDIEPSLGVVIAKTLDQRAKWSKAMGDTDPEQARRSAVAWLESETRGGKMFVKNGVLCVSREIRADG